MSLYDKSQYATTNIKGLKTAQARYKKGILFKGDVLIYVQRKHPVEDLSFTGEYNTAPVKPGDSQSLNMITSDVS